MSTQAILYIIHVSTQAIYTGYTIYTCEYTGYIHVSTQAILYIIHVSTQAIYM